MIVPNIVDGSAKLTSIFLKAISKKRYRVSIKRSSKILKSGFFLIKR